jgi:hypothetical protein
MTTLRRTFTNLARPALFAAILCAAFSFYVSKGMEDRGLNAPPESGDGHDYDAIAFNLWKYDRFGYDWDDPRWRQPYLNNPEYDDLLRRHSTYYPTTYKQPAVPLVMAVVDAATRRSFAAWRVVNCAITAGAVTAAAAISATCAGWPAAVITAVIVLTLSLPTLFAHQFMTEGLATFLVTLLTWRWIENRRRGWTTANAAGSGLILGALAATRSIFVLCMAIALFAPGVNRRSGTRPLSGRAICLLAALLVIGPWWVRNTVVLHTFMPLGTQGALNMPAGFGPRALRYEGLWGANPGDGAEEIAALNLGTVAAEVRLAKFRSHLTLEWMRAHPRDVVRLMALHVWQEIKPRRLPYPTDAWLLPAAALAAWVLRRSPGVGIIVAMTAANLVGIALTWSMAGRFMAPVQPILAALVGALVVVFARRVGSTILPGRFRDQRGEQSSPPQ